MRRHFFCDINHTVINGNMIILWARVRNISLLVIGVSDWLIPSPYSMMENDKWTSGKRNTICMKWVPVQTQFGNSGQGSSAKRVERGDQNYGDGSLCDQIGAGYSHSTGYKLNKIREYIMCTEGVSLNNILFTYISLDNNCLDVNLGLCATNIQV